MYRELSNRIGYLLGGVPLDSVCRSQELVLDLVCILPQLVAYGVGMPFGKRFQCVRSTCSLSNRCTSIPSFIPPVGFRHQRACARATARGAVFTLAWLRWIHWMLWHGLERFEGRPVSTPFLSLTHAPLDSILFYFVDWTPTLCSNRAATRPELSRTEQEKVSARSSKNSVNKLNWLTG
jgi:hypothetical protein